MFCTYCKSARPNNETPCPNCGAPSSQSGQSVDIGWGTPEPGTMMRGDATSSLNQHWNYQGPQLSFEEPVPSWQQISDSQHQPMPQQQPWGAYTTKQVQDQQQAPQLPVPYVGNTQTAYQPASMQLVPARGQEQMLPALPAEQEVQETVYIPPMYTKPRPIIPLYRIISGLLSIVLVSALLCGGSIYYANATGKLAGLQRLIGVAAPASMVNKPAPQIPDPPDKVDLGPAATIITSATTTLRIDQNSHTPREQDKILQVGVPFYITFSAKPPKPGYVVIKWYMNNQYYTETTSALINQPSISGDRLMVYSIPAESTAELYWMNQGGDPQLAQRLYFAVR